MKHCPACHGDGIDPAVKTDEGHVARGEWAAPCQECNGTGHVETGSTTAADRAADLLTQYRQALATIARMARVPRESGATVATLARVQALGAIAECALVGTCEHDSEPVLTAYGWFCPECGTAVRGPLDLVLDPQMDDGA